MIDIYTLGPDFKRSSIVNSYKEFVWTERFDTAGDFELVLNPSEYKVNQLDKGARLSVPQSTRVMVVDTVEEEIDSSGENILRVKGSSLEKVLGDRVIKQNRSTLELSPSWNIRGTPYDIMIRLFKTICVDGALSSLDILPGVELSSFYPVDNIPKPQEVVDVEIKPGNLKTSLEQMCTSYGLGYRLVLNHATSKIHFNVYSGRYRNDGVVFSHSLENFMSPSVVDTNADEKTVAYVFSKKGFVEVYAPGANTTADGYDRKVIHVTVEDVPEEVENVAVFLRDRGLEALSQNRSKILVDGEVPSGIKYKYDKDYSLGDIVTVHANGRVENMRVTEQIIASDNEGDRSYPTLSMEDRVVRGLWSSPEWNIIWPDALGEWSTV